MQKATFLRGERFCSGLADLRVESRINCPGMSGVIILIVLTQLRGFFSLSLSLSSVDFVRKLVKSIAYFVQNTRSYKVPVSFCKQPREALDRNVFLRQYFAINDCQRSRIVVSQSGGATLCLASITSVCRQTICIIPMGKQLRNGGTYS